MTSFSDALLPLLGDPETHAPLKLLGADELARLRAALAAGSGKRRDGKGVGDFEGALVGDNRRVAYLVQGGIPNLLIDERVELSEAL